MMTKLNCIWNNVNKKTISLKVFNELHNKSVLKSACWLAGDGTVAKESLHATLNSFSLTALTLPLTSLNLVHQGQYSLRDTEQVWLRLLGRRSWLDSRHDVGNGQIKPRNGSRIKEILCSLLLEEISTSFYSCMERRRQEHSSLSQSPLEVKSIQSKGLMRWDLPRRVTKKFFFPFTSSFL